ncbi:MAG: RdgB/HAM1 family non-canonical purine NTP pyrophosphatase [Candidatus Liptonbacteria bacterium]|nr:RdgB/HAM1 family non-canonical purine NTP pyrophosphatase [Candidatus Liptonbacteria bacterium]
MNKKLLLATRNKGKFPEIVSELKNIPFDFLNLNDVASLPPEYEVEESAVTFEGNAIIKAMTLGKKTGLLTLADDSGLEVDALGGRPGVYSARYAPGSDEDRYRKLLGELENVPDDKLGAQFHCSAAIYDPATDKVRTCEGIYRGRIIREPRGANGFGFDPIFWNEQLEKTNAEMSLEEKNSVSHRGMALAKAREILEKEFV